MTDPSSDLQDQRQLLQDLAKQVFELTDVVRQISVGPIGLLRHPRLDQIKADLVEIGRRLDG